MKNILKPLKRINLMFVKTLISSVFLIVVMASTAYAGGSHDHDHSEKKMPKPSGEMAHNDDHGGHNMSPVGTPASATKNVKIIAVDTNDDMRFKFNSNLKLTDGDIITFEVTNKGRIPHEFSIGDEEEQKSHREMMRKMPNMVHQDGNTITIPPGETKTLTWKFKGESEVVFACNIPGHFEAGMFKKSMVKSSTVQQH
jgi:uncharacterized cupredoxin-like copper-binding protein